ncbi:MAG: hypothetical protein ACOH2S_20450 [Janthinobacterium svalbardensis]
MNIDWSINWNAFSALATLAAAGVALWLASQDKRTRKKAEVLRANIVAASLAPRLESLSESLSMCGAHLAFAGPSSAHQPIASSQAERLLRIEKFVISTEELALLSRLGGNCATRLAYAISALELAQQHIRDHLAYADNATTKLTQAQTDRWQALIAVAAERITVVLRQCQAAANEFAPSPTGYELYGNEPE